MNLPQVARLMARFANLFSLAQLPALVLAWTERSAGGLTPLWGFCCSFALGLAVAELLRRISNSPGAIAQA